MPESTPSTLFQRLKRDAAAEWDAYVGHEFVRRLGDGSLPRVSFQHYLAQDYVFLIEFARAYAIAVWKAPSLPHMRKAATGISAILDETALHLRLCESWGMPRETIEATREARATIAYTRFVEEAGLRGDALDLAVALSPCVIGYAEIGIALRNEAAGGDNDYAAWITEYASDGYQRLASDSEAEIDALAGIYLTEARYPRLLSTFRTAVRLEIDFWQMGLDLAD